jgi:alginate O-acetyltransferase complex protein AlgI
MLFNSLEYACLLVGAIACSWLFVKRHRLRVALLLAASYVFYASWNAKYVALLFFSSSLDFFVGRFLGKTQNKIKRKLLLGASVVVNLGILCVFKYFNFFTVEAAALLRELGINANASQLNVLLPVGISFYTFLTLSYTIDVYRRQLAPCKSYFEYLLYVSFFPQLLAGPITRARVLLPQIARKPALTAENGSRAIYRICIGLVKKVAIADFLGAHIVDPVFSNPEMYSSIEALLAAYAYTFQIYADFSAYSDIAIGAAALLGFKIPENFDSPYRAASLREFWQRWHISLSTWLRDYLYIPLGGSRSGSFRVYANLMITMLLGGLWHGAAMTFVAWGVLHGAALVVTRIVQRAVGGFWKPSKALRAVGVFLTFHVVAAGWVLFRADSFEAVLKVFESIGSFDFEAANVSWPLLLALGVAILTHWIPEEWMERSRRLFHAAPAALQAALLIAAVLLVRQIARADIAPFIYFQF